MQHVKAPFHIINLLVATIVARAGVTFAVLVGQAASESLEHGDGCVVFGWNQSDAIFLARFFGFDDVESFGIGSRQVGSGPGCEGTKGEACTWQQGADRLSEHYFERRQHL